MNFDLNSTPTALLNLINCNTDTNCCIRFAFPISSNCVTLKHKGLKISINKRNPSSVAQKSSAWASELPQACTVITTARFRSPVHLFVLRYAYVVTIPRHICSAIAAISRQWSITVVFYDARNDSYTADLNSNYYCHGDPKLNNNVSDD